MAPLELFVLKYESLEISLVELFQALSFHHLHWIFPLHLDNIGMDAFTSHIAVERLGEVRFNAVPAFRRALSQVLQEGDLFWNVIISVFYLI